MRSHAEAEFKEYVAARSHALWHTAYLMCGDAHHAEDLVQTALMKLYGAWHKVERSESREAYVRRILVRCLIDEKRRGWRREHPVASLPEVAVAGGFDGVETGERDAALRALAQLAPRQRATLVLRFWEDQSIEQTAHAMGCSTGTVRSQTARGLATLRGLLLAEQATASGRGEKEF
jgi:RNA polymerase sigma-70 factor (sigma-E family)